MAKRTANLELNPERRAWILGILRGESPPEPQEEAPVVEFKSIWHEDATWQKSLLSPFNKFTKDEDLFSQILSLVPNELMRGLVREAYTAATKAIPNLSPLPEENDYLNYCSGVTQDAKDYRDWLRRKLYASDLSRQLPLGREGLPDIHDAMYEPWRSIEKLQEPRNFKQLIQHVAGHLDWYLDTSQKVKLPIKEIGAAAGLLSIIIVIGLQALGVISESWFIWLIYGASSAAVVWLVSKIWGQQDLGGAKVSQFHHLRKAINLAELYYYLASEYVEDLGGE